MRTGPCVAAEHSSGHGASTPRQCNTAGAAGVPPSPQAIAHREGAAFVQAFSTTCDVICDDLPLAHASWHPRREDWGSCGQRERRSGAVGAGSVPRRDAAKGLGKTVNRQIDYVWAGKVLKANDGAPTCCTTVGGGVRRAQRSGGMGIDQASSPGNFPISAWVPEAGAGSPGGQEVLCGRLTKAKSAADRRAPEASGRPIQLRLGRQDAHRARTAMAPPPPPTAATPHRGAGGGKENGDEAALREQVYRRVLSSGVLNTVKVRPAHV